MVAAFSSLAFIDGVGGPELMLILLVTLLLFGGKQLPELARGLGKSMKEFKKAAAGVENEIKKAIDEAPAPRAITPASTVPVTTTPPPPPQPATFPSHPPANPNLAVTQMPASPATPPPQP